MFEGSIQKLSSDRCFRISTNIISSYRERLGAEVDTIPLADNGRPVGFPVAQVLIVPRIIQDSRIGRGMIAHPPHARTSFAVAKARRV